MDYKTFNTKAHPAGFGDQIVDLMLTSEILRYYFIYPKTVRRDSAVFYAPPFMTDGKKRELETILGFKIKFETITEGEILHLIELCERKKDNPGQFRISF